MRYGSGMAQKQTYKKLALDERGRRRNNALFDVWSVVHFCTGVALGWLANPFIALAVMVLWEPLEVLVLSPLLARRGITFGYETLRNSLSDIVFDIAGVALGYIALTAWVVPPVHLF